MKKSIVLLLMFVSNSMGQTVTPTPNPIPDHRRGFRPRIIIINPGFSQGYYPQQQQYYPQQQQFYQPQQQYQQSYGQQCGYQQSYDTGSCYGGCYGQQMTYVPVPTPAPDCQTCQQAPVYQQQPIYQQSMCQQQAPVYSQQLPVQAPVYAQQQPVYAQQSAFVAQRTVIRQRSIAFAPSYATGCNVGAGFVPVATPYATGFVGRSFVSRGFGIGVSPVFVGVGGLGHGGFFGHHRERTVIRHRGRI